MSSTRRKYTYEAMRSLLIDELVTAIHVLRLQEIGATAHPAAVERVLTRAIECLRGNLPDHAACIEGLRSLPLPQVTRTIVSQAIAKFDAWHANGRPN